MKLDNIKEIFEKVENYKNLILPIFYQQLMEPITFEEIHDFNNYLINFYGKEMKNLISQLENISEIPNEIICKYWIRAYTLEGDFYKTVKTKLQQKKGKFLLPYIKMLYEGIKNKTFKSIFSQDLYRGTIISNSELEKIRTYLDSNNINLINEQKIPKVIVYIKPFQSYTMKKNIAIKFMNKAKKREKHSNVLFIINKKEYDLKEELFSNAYIADYSKYKSEDEVLFFPYSCFGIEKINQVDNHLEISLEYLGKYKSYLEKIKPIELLLNDIPISQFGKDITELGLIKYNFQKYWKVIKTVEVTEGDCSSLLCLNNQYILMAIQNILRIYDIKKEKIIQNIMTHRNIINDLLKIEENKIISSSKDRSIQFIELTNNYANFNLIKSIKIHIDEVNQTIKLEDFNNTYASCSNDKTIIIFKLENEVCSIFRNLKGHESEIISIFESPNKEIISMSKLGYLKFWNYQN